MSERTSGCGCLKGCGIGCGCLVLITIAIVVLTTVVAVAPLNRAIESRKVLDEQFGSQEAYCPAANGVPTADRLRAFITVRENLGPACESISDIAEQMHNMERFDGQDDVSKVEIMSQAMKTSQAAIMIAPALADFFGARNTALLEAKMGLGEYTYLYVLIYHDQLIENSTEDGIFGGESINSRVQAALLEILKAQRNAFSGAAEAPHGVTALDDEILAMINDDSRIPWQDGIPEPVAAAIEPFRDELDRVFCEDTTAIELQRNRRKYLSIISE